MSLDPDQNAVSPEVAAPGAASTGWVTARPPRIFEIARRVLSFPSLVAKHSDLIGTSVRRDLEARFRGTILGWMWPLVHPIFMFGIYFFIFTELLQIKMPDLPDEKKAAMGVFMFTGITVWTSVAESLIRGTNAIVDNGNLIKKLAFPSEVLPLNVTLVGLVTQSFAIVVFVLLCFLTPMWPRPGMALAWIPLLILIQGLFTYGLALFLSTMQVFLRDTLQVVGIATTVWMFLTPLFWTPTVMPKNVGVYLPFIEANPVFHLVQAWRVALMGGIEVPVNDNILGGWAVQPSRMLEHVSVFSIWAVAVFALGYAFFVLSQRRFADEV